MENELVQQVMHELGQIACQGICNVILEKIAEDRHHMGLCGTSLAHEIALVNALPGTLSRAQGCPGVGIVSDCRIC